MKVKIIGGYHKGRCLTVQDNIVQLVLPSAMRATFSIEDDEPYIAVCESHQYKLYKQYRYLGGDTSSYFIPHDWAHEEVERRLMDAIPCVN
ncbi:hypothetical protein [Pectobacterium phage Zenivior_B1]|uniref:Uncharacterized protein n=2 Tax=Phimunavirus zenivior TaxID=2733345 RepID=A0A3G8FJU8_9CAUD|nr:hypothetical protein HOU75_gp38 [Pectobacterium phage Zenivior]AZF94999.1 hypothetical protein [Pectobacterium phage Zenivior]AZF95041.1 hypothetical protein [Pectobacterium phage Zenivior_B1]